MKTDAFWKEKDYYPFINKQTNHIGHEEIIFCNLKAKQI